jgi:hypothetical protein
MPPPCRGPLERLDGGVKKAHGSRAAPYRASWIAIACKLFRNVDRGVA